MTSRALQILLFVCISFFPASGSIGQEPKADVIPTSTIRDAADRVMQQHDYRSVRRRVLEQIPDKPDGDGGFLLNLLDAVGDGVGNFLEWIFSGLFSRPNRVNPGRAPTPAAPPAGSGPDFSFAKMLLFVGLAVLIVLVIWIVAAVVRTSDGRRKLNSDGLFGDDEDLANLSVPPGELAASTYEGRALQMSRDGNYRGAIRELLIGSMSWIERAGLIRYRKGLTNRDYVRAVWKQEPRRDAYIATAMAFERIYFGRREATAEMFRDCLTSFQSSFREEEADTKV